MAFWVAEFNANLGKANEMGTHCSCEVHLNGITMIIGLGTVSSYFSGVQALGCGFAKGFQLGEQVAAHHIRSPDPVLPLRVLDQKRAKKWKTLIF
jgi:hypothetical protein